MISKEEVQKLAELARIDVPEDEQKELVTDIESILEYISQIQEVVSGAPEPKAGEHRNIVREDGEPHASGLHTEDLLEAAPKREGQYVKVKKIINQ